MIKAGPCTESCIATGHLPVSQCSIQMPSKPHFISVPCAAAAEADFRSMPSSLSSASCVALQTFSVGLQQLQLLCFLYFLTCCVVIAIAIVFVIDTAAVLVPTKFIRHPGPWL